MKQHWTFILRGINNMLISQYMYQEVCDLLCESEEHCKVLITEKCGLIKENEKLKKHLNDVTFIKIKKNNNRYMGLPSKAIVVKAFKRLDNTFMVEGRELINKGARRCWFDADFLYPFTEEQVKCLL